MRLILAILRRVAEFCPVDQFREIKRPVGKFQKSYEGPETRGSSCEMGTRRSSPFGSPGKVDQSDDALAPGRTYPALPRVEARIQEGESTMYRSPLADYS